MVSLGFKLLVGSHEQVSALDRFFAAPVQTDAAMESPRWS